MTRDDIEALIRRHGAVVIAAVAGLLLAAQILIAVIEQWRGAVHIYEGLVVSSLLVAVYLAVAGWLRFPNWTLPAYGGLLAALALAQVLHLSAWLEFPPLASFMGLVILLQQREHYVWAIRAFLAGVLLVGVQTAIVVSGLTATTLWILPVTAMTAGFVLGRRQGVAYAAVCIGVIVTLGTAADAGLLASHFPRSPWYYVAVLSILVLIAAYLGISAMNRYREAFDDVLTLSRELADEARAANAARTRLQAVFEANPLPSTIMTEQGTIVDCNTAWQHFTGVTREQAAGKSGLELQLWSDVEKFAAVMAQARHDGHIAGMAGVINAPQGQREMLIYLQPILLDGVRHFVSCLYDQTDRVAAEAAQRELNESLEQRVAEANRKLASVMQELAHNERLASLGSTVAGVAHELNTPIGNARMLATSIQAVNDEALTAFNDNTLKRSLLESCLRQSRDMAALIDQSTQRAADLIERYKQLAIEQTSESRERFNLGDLLTRTLANHGPGAETPWRLRCDAPADIVCDSYPLALEQVLSALLQNAQRHGFAGRSAGQLTVRAESRGAPGSKDQVARVHVQDDGVGMDEATLAKLFDPFFTTKFGQGGSGLGLAIAHRLATTVLAGRLSAVSSPGAGSTLTLEFPCIAPGRI